MQNNQAKGRLQLALCLQAICEPANGNSLPAGMSTPPRRKQGLPKRC